MALAHEFKVAVMFEGKPNIACTCGWETDPQTNNWMYAGKQMDDHLEGVDSSGPSQQEIEVRW